MKIKSLCVLPLLLASCTEAAIETPTKGDAPFDISDTGKADGSGLLSAADQARIETAFDRAVSASEQTIKKLETEIAKLEAQHAAKQQEANALVASIASREQQLRDQYNDNLILCVFLPNPVTCVLANFLANDSTLKSYKSQLAAAQQQQQKIMQDIAAYTAKRGGLRAKLSRIRAGKTRMISLLRDGVTIIVPSELTPSPATANAYQRAEVMLRVEKALAAEIAVLVDIRNAAVELANSLDQSLATLRSLQQSVDALVTNQRKVFMDLLFGFLSGDPQAAADKWLEDVLAQKTRTLLNQLDWPLNEFARFLVESRGGPGDVEALVQRILAKLAAQSEPLLFVAPTSVDIHDLTTVQSSLHITQARTITALEVFVSIEHTYVGDLVITLENGSQVFVLQSRLNATDHVIEKTFQVPAAANLPLAGNWTLVVHDTEAPDTGKLLRWHLIAR